MIYGNFGRREVGKTTLALYLIHRYPLRVILDPRGLVPLGANGVRLTRVDELAAAFTRAHEDKGGEILVTPERSVQGAFESLSREVKRWLEDRPEPIAFLVDEARFVELEDCEDFGWILRCAPRDSTAIALSAHRPIDIHGNVRAIMDQWCLFQMTHQNDLRVIEDHCGRVVADQLPGLPPFKFIGWNDTNGTWAIYNDPTKWATRRTNPGGSRIGIDGAPLDGLSGKVDTVAKLF